MLKSHEQLVNSYTNKGIGNHSVHVTYDATEDVTKRTFHYHGNTICVVDYGRGLFYVDNAGWFTSSTTRAMNSYRHYFRTFLNETTKEEYDALVAEEPNRTR